MNRRSTPHSPREAAWRALCEYDTRHPNWDDLLGRALADLSGPDRALAGEILTGTLRYRRLIDAVIERAIGRKQASAKPDVWNLIRSGAHQILFLDRVPDHAAVNETVEIAKRHAKRAAGFVNAALRAVIRVRDGGDVTPDLPPAVRHSLPDVIWRALTRLLPEEEWEAAAGALNHPGPLGLRRNPFLKAPSPLVGEGVGGEGEAVEGVGGEGLNPHPLVPGALTCPRAHLDRLRPLLDEGSLVVQDPASQLVALLVAPRRGQCIADLCAAPGGKSAHLAALMSNEGRVIATDIDPERLRHLEETVARLRATCVEVADWSRLEGRLAEAQPEVILIDAPCSGWGTVRHRPDLKWRRRSRRALATRQIDLLRLAARHARAGATLVHSVCTFLPEETTGVLEAFLAEDSRFAVQDAREVLPSELHGLVDANGAVRTWPHRHACDGFFAARLIRR